MFESLGAAVIDSDRLNHEQLRSPEIIETLRSWWGDRVIAPSGQVDRRTVADIVFASPKELKRLQDLTYPRIERRRNELLGLYDADERVKAIVLDSPKLFDTGLDRLCDAVVFVEADREKRLQRAAAARGWMEEEVTRRENLQNRLDSKSAKADYTVVNNSSIDDLRPSIESILASVLASFAADPRGGSSAENASS
jgi:dephospho-CoA kinase